MMKKYILPDREKIKKFLPDALCILIIMAVAFPVAGRPGIDLNPKPQAVVSVPDQAPARGTEAGERGIIRPVHSAKALKERNIFTASGSYGESAGKPLPENPYFLIGVLRGKEMRAVFKDYTGTVGTWSVGKKMIDDFEISRIDSVSVTLKRRDETKVLQLFSGGGSAVAGLQEKQPIKSSYTLTAIFGGSQKKAAFRDHRGSMAIMATGGKLRDGAVITGIGDQSVKLKKGEETIVLRLSDVYQDDMTGKFRK
jgi:hypothetical protein